jgi:hypothetical protein
MHDRRKAEKEEGEKIFTQFKKVMPWQRLLGMKNVAMEIITMSSQVCGIRPGDR